MAALLPASPGLRWIECHCDEDIFDFNQGVRELRAAVEPRGCRVVSSLLMRDPVHMAVSEWQYFYANQTHHTNRSAAPRPKIERRARLMPFPSQCHAVA